MSSFSFGTVATSVVLSSLASFYIVMFLQHKSGSAPIPLIRTSKLEVVDSRGRVRGVFGLNESDKSDQTPRLVLLNSDERESIQLELDQRGYGYLAFGSNRWAEGEVILGHLKLDDVVRDLKEDPDDRNGAWGLMVRGQGYDSTGIGFINSGQVLAPKCGGLQPALHKIQKR